MLGVPNEVLLDLYGGCDQPQRWRPMLDRICSDLGARSAVVQVFRRDGDRMRQQWVMRDSFSTANAELHDAFVNNEDNPRTDLRIASPIGTSLIMRDCDAFRPGCPRLAGLQQRLLAVGLGQAVAIGFPLLRDTSFSLILHRSSHDMRPFADSEEAYLLDLAPHFEQMFRLARAREDSAADLFVFQEALQGLRVGLAICDVDRRVSWLNAAADGIIRRSRYLSTKDGVLKASRFADERKVEALVRGAAAANTSGERRMLALGEAQPDAVQILAWAVPCKAQLEGYCSSEEVRIALLISEAKQMCAFSAREVTELFGLSPSEATLAVALCQGSTLNDYARNRGISVGTARIQLKRVMSKMNVHRQAALVLQICGSVMGQTFTAMH